MNQKLLVKKIQTQVSNWLSTPILYAQAIENCIRIANAFIFIGKY